MNAGDEVIHGADMKKAIKEMGFVETTPIQSAAIPSVLEGRDIIAQAPTGTGKTFTIANVINQINMEG